MDIPDWLPEGWLKTSFVVVAAAILVFSLTSNLFQSFKRFRGTVKAAGRMVGAYFMVPYNIEHIKGRVGVLAAQQELNNLVTARLVENGTYGTFQCDLSGSNTDVNLLYCKWLDATEADLLEFGWRSFITRPDLAAWDAQWKPAMAEGRRFTGEMRFRNGIKVVVDVIKVHAGGQHVGYYGFMRRIGIEVETPSDKLNDDDTGSPRAVRKS